MRLLNTMATNAHTTRKVANVNIRVVVELHGSRGSLEAGEMLGGRVVWYDSSYAVIIRLNIHVTRKRTLETNI